MATLGKDVDIFYRFICDDPRLPYDMPNDTCFDLDHVELKNNYKRSLEELNLNFDLFIEVVDMGLSNILEQFDIVTKNYLNYNP